MPVLLERKMAAADAYRMVQVPTTYYIDAKGIITNRTLGPLSENALLEELRKLSP